MNKKRDIVTSRTAQDVESKYGKRIINTEKEAESQNRDLASLTVKVNNLISVISSVNSQIQEINQMCDDLEASIDGLDLSIQGLDTRVQAVELTSHTHENKVLIDALTQEDIDKWNSVGNYILLAENVVVNQQIEGIDEYNLIFLQLNNVNRYIPCFKYENTNIYKGVNLEYDQNLNLTMEEISMEIQNEIVINIISNNSILKIIGIL